MNKKAGGKLRKTKERRNQQPVEGNRMSEQQNQLTAKRQQVQEENKGVGGSVSDESDEENDGKQPLRLRLDLNLDAEVQVKAKLRGDLTLSML